MENGTVTKESNDPEIICGDLAWMIVKQLTKLGLQPVSDWNEVLSDKDECYHITEHNDQNESYDSIFRCSSETTYEDLVKVFTEKFGEGREPREGVHNWIHRGGLIVMGYNEGYFHFSVRVDYHKVTLPYTFE